MAHHDPAALLAAFSNDLDQHCLTHTDFFNRDLLLLFEKYFGYHDTSINAYTDEYRYCGCVAINDALPLRDYYIKNRIYEFDEFSRRITEQCLHTDGIKPMIFNSLETLPSDESGNQYRAFLGKFGFTWTASMVFRHYRMTIYKKDREIFSPVEVSLLNQVYALLSSRAMLYEQIAAHRSSMDSLKDILDYCQTGYVILSDTFHVVSYNDAACKFLSDLTGLNNMVYSLKNTLAALQIDPAAFSQQDSISRLYKDKLFVIRKQLEKQSFDFYTTKYILIITPAGESSSVNELSRELFRKKYSISPKEQAIIDLLASGMTYAQAAEHLFISINTVRSHVKSIYSKAGVKNLRSLLSLYKTIEP